MRDIDFHNLDISTTPNGDLRTVTGVEVIRQMIYRWLLSMPIEDTTEINAEEIEPRAVYPTPAARQADYNSPVQTHGRASLLATLPWDTTWGLGIKQYLNQPITNELLQELQTRVTIGLIKLDGITRVNQVTVSALSSQLTIYWDVETTEGKITDYTAIHQGNTLITLPNVEDIPTNPITPPYRPGDPI